MFLLAGFLGLSLVFFMDVAFLSVAEIPSASVASGAFFTVLFFVSLHLQFQVQSFLSDQHFEQGLYHDGLSGLSIFVSKVLFHFLFLLGFAVAVAGLFTVFRGNLGDGIHFPIELIGLIVLACLNLALLQSFIFSVFAQVESGQLLTSILLYPLMAPLLIICVKSGYLALHGLHIENMQVLLGVAVISFSLGGLLFETVVEELL